MTWGDRSLELEDQSSGRLSSLGRAEKGELSAAPLPGLPGWKSHPRFLSLSETPQQGGLQSLLK